MAPDPSRSPWVPRGFLLALALGLCLSLALAAYYYVRERDEILTEQTATLAAIADLKLAQLASWRAGLRDDAAILRDDPFLAAALDQFLDSPFDRGTRELLRSWVAGQIETFGYQSVMLVDATGRVVLGTGLDSAVLGASARAEVATALAIDDVLLSDIHRSEGGTALHLDIVVPLNLAGSGTARGAVFFRVDPTLSLFPLISRWPTPSPSSEITLVRREGETVRYLNRPRFAPPDANPLSLSRPSSTPDLLAVRALARETGVVEGVDYRGVPVLGALRKVPDSDWAFVAKVDLAEIEGEARRQAVLVGVVAGLLIFLFGGLVAAAWRKRALKTLQASEQNFRALFDSTPLGVGLVRRRVVLWANPAYLAMTGHQDPAEIEGRPLPETLAPSQRQAVTEFALRWEKGGEMPNQVETLLVRKDRSEFPVLATLHRVTLFDGPATAVFFRDLTEQRRSETETLRRQKLEVVTALTEGLAHDINNILTAVIGNLSLARLLAGDPARLPGKLAEAEAAAMQIKELVNRMAAHARGEEPRSLVFETEPLLRAAARETATPLRPFDPAWKVEEGLWPLQADPLRLRQALEVVMQNAAEAEASPGRGEPVEIAAGNLLLPEAPPPADGLAAGRYVRIAICDRGPGIPPEALGRIFDPYFSTKRAPSDKGAGLGLHFAQAVIRHHHGSIAVEPRPGGGTAVTILLPATSPVHASSAEQS